MDIWLLLSRRGDDESSDDLDVHISEQFKFPHSQIVRFSDFGNRGAFCILSNIHNRLHFFKKGAMASGHVISHFLRLSATSVDRGQGLLTERNPFLAFEPLVK